MDIRNTAFLPRKPFARLDADRRAFNPMYHYVSYFRDIAMYNTLPGVQENLVCLGIAAITFAVGFLVFRKTEKKFILYV